MIALLLLDRPLLARALVGKGKVMMMEEEMPPTRQAPLLPTTHTAAGVMTMKKDALYSSVIGAQKPSTLSASRISLLELVLVLEQQQQQ